MAGRPPIYTPESKVRIDAYGENKLQEGSARRAVINLLVNNRGAMTLGAINAHFDMDMLPTILDLVKVKWARIE